MSDRPKQPKEFTYICECLETLGYTLVQSYMKSTPESTTWRCVYSNGKQIIELSTEPESQDVGVPF